MQALPRNGRITLGADKAYDTEAFVAALRANQVTPHVAQNDTTKASAIDRRTTRHRGYGMSRARRFMVERVPAWLKNVALLRKVKHRGRQRIDWMFVFALVPTTW